MDRLLSLVLLPFLAVTAFRDDFNSWNAGNYKVDVTAWGGGNHEFQVYTPEHENLYVRDGHLYIRPTFTTNSSRFAGQNLYNGDMNLYSIWGQCTQHDNNGCHKTAHGNEILPPVMSGKITTNFAMTYGRVNVRAKIPKGDWLWPAIWLLPRDWSYGGWPRSGEIDIMESRGNVKAILGGVNQGVNDVQSTLHWGPAYNHNAFYKTHGSKRKDGGDDWHGWHTYSLDWTADHIITYVDNAEILRINTPSQGFWNWGGFSGNNIWSSGGRNAPFDKPFHLILNVAVGGDFFGDGQYDTYKPWGHSSHPMRDFWEARGSWQHTWRGEDVAMIIDYIEMIPH
ncbi:beta-1,3-glucan-binding protein-like [Pecten maximus]|uniref:beta-1,3-glucan-binding protein-like n=1 Tax=Pecten maximus TaxID=6579 RepID=UPI0014585695|nr:beta-1,3-glucan-binding protein-like [Pecten maximus]